MITVICYRRTIMLALAALTLAALATRWILDHANELIRPGDIGEWRVGL